MSALDASAFASSPRSPSLDMGESGEAGNAIQITAALEQPDMDTDADTPGDPRWVLRATYRLPAAPLIHQTSALSTLVLVAVDRRTFTPRLRTLSATQLERAPADLDPRTGVRMGQVILEFDRDLDLPATLGRVSLIASMQSWTSAVLELDLDLGTAVSRES